MDLKSWTSTFLLAFSLTACSETDNASIEISGLNYTNTWITAFSVDSYAGHGISPNGGGGKFVCCVTVQGRLRAVMQVTIRWTEDERVPDSWKERVVDIPEYTSQDMGAFAVHFYPDDTVKVLVTAKTEGHPDYPYPRPN